MTFGSIVYIFVWQVYIFVDDDTGDSTNAPMDVYAHIFFSL